MRVDRDAADRPPNKVRTLGVAIGFGIVLPLIIVVLFNAWGWPEIPPSALWLFLLVGVMVGTIAKMRGMGGMSVGLMLGLALLMLLLAACAMALNAA